jgi:hypothetical protein
VVEFGGALTCSLLAFAPPPSSATKAGATTPPAQGL